jgi:hypothetical protein
MREEIFHLRPVPRRYRCDKCREVASVIVDVLYLCGDCFLEESEERYGKPLKSADAAEDTRPCTRC